MCTILLSFEPGREARYPVVVAANRDEFLAREAAPPGISPSTEDPNLRILCGTDLTAGGTWMGLNSAGVFAGLTNRYTGNPPDRSKRSRGALVTECLQHRSVDEVVSLLEGADLAAYNPFNLLLADTSKAYVCTNLELRRRFLPAGIHVLTNADLDEGGGEKGKRLAAPFEALVKTRGRVRMQVDADVTHALL